jgi:hypothetical protein
MRTAVTTHLTAARQLYASLAGGGDAGRRD